MAAYRIDPSLLEEVELEYEEAIRTPSGETPGQGATLLLGKVQQRMDREWTDHTDPITIGRVDENDAAAIEQDLNECGRRTKELFAQVDNQIMLNMMRMPIENAPKIKTRLLHYEYRLKRLPIAALSPEQTKMYEKRLTRVMRYQSALDPLLQPNMKMVMP